jgi:hypothetical protein
MPIRCWVTALCLVALLQPARAGEADERMADLASPEEIRTALAADAVGSGYSVFTEDRLYSIRRDDAIPRHWLARPAGERASFSGVAQPGEFYVFQIGVFAAVGDVSDLRLRFSDLTRADGGMIPASALRCFNLGGTDFLGAPFVKRVDVPVGHLQALWIGIDTPRDASGRYEGTVAVSASQRTGTAVRVTLDVNGEVLEDRGDADAWRLARLRWLDSTIGLDADRVVKPFTPIRCDGRKLLLLGREVLLGQDGLPEQVNSFFSESNTRVTDQAKPLLAAPVRLVVAKGGGETAAWEAPSFHFVRATDGEARWEADSASDNLRLHVEGSAEFDGFISCKLRVSATADTAVEDIRLEWLHNAAAATYFMGLGKQGGLRPADLDWAWNRNVNQDGYWMGAVNGGLKVRFKGANFKTPLINAYYHFSKINLPESWDNDGRGGIRLRTTADGHASVAAFSGPRALKAGEELQFDFDLLVTPFKPLDTDAQWRDRYLHPHQGQNDPHTRNVALVREMGANILTIHHNMEPNPAINYPYYAASFPLLQECVRNAHSNDVRVKIYYTTREITSNLPELWAFKSLGSEIIFPGPGRDAKPVTNPNGPHPWLIKNLRDNFLPAWREVVGGRYKGLLDLAVITTPDSRLDNFYLEGLAFTIRNAGIDGLYIDDTTLGRKSFQRARRIFEDLKGSALIDMHSWSHFNDLAGMTPSAYVFMGNFPYYDRIWFGEGFNYNTPADYWLVEISGIPFGLMGEMLQGGGNPWRGLLFGMTTRLGWSGDPRPIWKLWDEFGMEGTEMIGWWDPANPLRTGREDVPATVYRKHGKALIALASWAPRTARVMINGDWNDLGLNPGKVMLYGPAVEGHQEEIAVRPGDPIPVSPGRGWLLIADETPRELKPPMAADPLKGKTAVFEDSFASGISNDWGKVVSKLPTVGIESSAEGLAIAAPANVFAFVERPWVSGATVGAAHIDPMKDAGQSWGVGLAVAWENGRFVQINCRTDGRWGVRTHAAESLPDGCARGTSAIVAAVLSAKSVFLLAGSGAGEDWDVVAEFPRSEFPGDPASIRVGKLGAAYPPADFSDPGAEGACRVNWVRLY